MRSHCPSGAQSATEWVRPVSPHHTLDDLSNDWARFLFFPSSFFFIGVNDFSVTWPKFRRYILALSLPLQLHFKVELVGIITVTKTDGYLGIKSSHRFPTDMEPWDIPTVEEPSDVHRYTNAPEHCDQQKCTVENLIQERLLKPINR